VSPHLRRSFANQNAKSVYQQHSHLPRRDSPTALARASLPELEKPPPVTGFRHRPQSRQYLDRLSQTHREFETLTGRPLERLQGVPHEERAAEYTTKTFAMAQPFRNSRISPRRDSSSPYRMLLLGLLFVTTTQPCRISVSSARCTSRALAGCGESASHHWTIPCTVSFA